MRRLIEENSAIAQAEEATLANATLSEQTLLATTVIELRCADADIDLQQQTVDAYREALRVTKAQGQAGITATPPSAVITAQVALETAQASSSASGWRARNTRTPSPCWSARIQRISTFRIARPCRRCPIVPTGVPSTLLQRRPDIAAAERTMEAQNAAIGVAVAAYYPTLSLSAAAGFSQSPLNGLLHAANHVWSSAPTARKRCSISARGMAKSRRRKAAYEAAVASYRGTVLIAFAGRGERSVRAAHPRRSGAGARYRRAAMRCAAREIALAEFQAGTVDYTTVAQAQETQFSDQQTRSPCSRAA